jgi:hypothetical protein
MMVRCGRARGLAGVSHHGSNVWNACLGAGCAAYFIFLDGWVLALDVKVLLAPPCIFHQWLYYITHVYKIFRSRQNHFHVHASL